MLGGGAREGEFLLHELSLNFHLSPLPSLPLPLGRLLNRFTKDTEAIDVTVRIDKGHRLVSRLVE